MENIKFIRSVMEYSSLTGTELGNFFIVPMQNGNVAKCCCEANGVRVEIVNKKEGVVDRTIFPFANYFTQKKCSPNAPMWDQHIENGKWYFQQYAHCLPTPQDFRQLACAVDTYIRMMD